MVATIRLPHADPGLKVTGSHYFEENIAKVPSGSPEYQIVAAPEERWGKVQVFWQGLRVGQLRLDAQQERHMLMALSLLGPAGTVFGAAGVTTEENAVDLSDRTSALQPRTRVQLMMPQPGRLERWAKAGPGERGGILLSEPVTVQVRLKNQGSVQDVPQALVAGEDEYRGKASIDVGTEESGKYKGRPRLDFLVKKQSVGSVGGRYQEEEAALFTAVLDGCMKTADVHIRQSNFGDNALYATVEFPAG